MLNKYEDYPFTVGNYMNLVSKLEPHWYATMDYPCEPEISRSIELSTNEQRIRATVDKAREILDLAEIIPHSTAVPVIQGYTLEEYLFCLKLHKEAGTIRPYMAVGSMCRRLSAHQLENLIPQIYERAKEYGCTKLHYFGLKLSKDLVPLREYIYSQDSAAIYYHYSKKARKKGRWPRGQEEKRAAVENFLVRASELGLNYRGATVSAGTDKSYEVKLANFRTETFKHIAEFRGYDSVDEWMSAILETAIDHEFDCFYDEYPDWRITPVFKE